MTVCEQNAELLALPKEVAADQLSMQVNTPLNYIFFTCLVSDSFCKLIATISVFHLAGNSSITHVTFEMFWMFPRIIFQSFTDQSKVLHADHQ